MIYTFRLAGNGVSVVRWWGMNFVLLPFAFFEKYLFRSMKKKWIVNAKKLNMLNIYLGDSSLLRVWFFIFLTTYCSPKCFGGSDNEDIFTGDGDPKCVMRSGKTNQNKKEKKGTMQATMRDGWI